MKKALRTIIAAAVIGAMALALAGCGGGTGSGDSGSASGKSASAGETIDNGVFSAVCPDGYRNITQTDVFGEKDADGNFPVSQELMVFSYGAESDYDIFSKPSVSIFLLSSSMTAESSMSSFDIFYDSYEETTFNVNGEDISGAKVVNDDYTYDIGYVEKDGRVFQITVVTSNEDGDSGISMESPDVQAVCDSITITGEPTK